MPQELIGDSARGDAYAHARLVVEGERILEADVPGMSRSLAGLTFKAGRQYTLLTVSFDPGDRPSDAAEKKKIALAELGQPDAGDAWHFLTGDDASIAALTNAVGFVYRWDPASRQFFHAAGIMLLTPDGTLSRYFYGIQFSSVDLRLGLVEASHHRVGSVADTVLLYCSHYDALTGKYDWVATRLLSLAGVLTIAILGTLLTILARPEQRQLLTGIVFRETTTIGVRYHEVTRERLKRAR